MTAHGVTIFDGGASRELMRLGTPFRQPEWSALALIEAPEYVSQLYRSFAEAGADMVTVNAYAVVPFHIGEERFWNDGAQLAADAARRAREIGDEFNITVAGDLPPVLGSYRPDLFEPDAAGKILGVLVSAQAPYVDVWLAETLSSIAEASMTLDVLEHQRVDQPVWVSFTLADQLDTDGRARLRSGERVADAVAHVLQRGAELVSFNCSPPEVMEPAVREARSVSTTVPIAVYANAFDTNGHGANDDGSFDDDEAANTALHGLRAELAGEGYLAHARRWVNAGATAVGGCCGIGSDEIAILSGADWTGPN